MVLPPLLRDPPNGKKRDFTLERRFCLFSSGRSGLAAVAAGDDGGFMDSDDALLMFILVKLVVLSEYRDTDLIVWVNPFTKSGSTLLFSASSTAGSCIPAGNSGLSAANSGGPNRMVLVDGEVRAATRSWYAWRAR